MLYGDPTVQRLLNCRIAVYHRDVGFSNRKKRYDFQECSKTGLRVYQR